MKEKLDEEIERGSPLKLFITSSSVVTNKVADQDNNNFLVFYKIILHESM
jgi:hypothetical protein